MNKLLFTLLIITNISANVFSQKVDKNIIFPIEAKNRSGEYRSDGGDTLFATMAYAAHA